MSESLSPPFTGRCRCGSVRYVCEAPPLWQAHCHCASCRRATGGLFASYFGMADGSWRWTGEFPAVYQPGEGVERLFCLICGAPIAYRGKRWPGEMHFLAGTLDDISGYAPESNAFAKEALPWLHLENLIR